MNTEIVFDMTPKLVLDTNACLDWFVFQDASVQPLVRAVTSGQVALVACPVMREELSHMLRHASLARWKPDAESALAGYDLYVTLFPMPQPGTDQRLPCSDSDDQIFIDLAVTLGAAWLVTHDRALLKLARRASRLGVQVLRPRDWPGLPLDPSLHTDPTTPTGRSAALVSR